MITCSREILHLCSIWLTHWVVKLYPNFIYDLQKLKAGITVVSGDFEKMHTLAGKIAFGCNIPLFTFAYKTVVSEDISINVRGIFIS